MDNITSSSSGFLPLVTPPKRSLFTASPTTQRLGKVYQTPPHQSPIPRLSFTSPVATSGQASIRLPFSPSDMDDSPTSVALNRRILVRDHTLGVSSPKAGVLGAANFTCSHLGYLTSPCLFTDSTNSMTAEEVLGESNYIDPKALGSSTGASVPFQNNVDSEAAEFGHILGMTTDDQDNQEWGMTTFAGAHISTCAQPVQTLTEFFWISGCPVTPKFLSSCHFYHHDPSNPCLTNIDILFRLGNYFGPGITKSELRQAFRRCKACHHYLYADMRAHHVCHGAVFPLEQAGFDFVTSTLEFSDHGGLSLADMSNLFSVCSRCNHVILFSRREYHECNKA